MSLSPPPTAAPSITAAGCITPLGAGGSGRAWRSWAEIHGGAPGDLAIFKWGDLFESAFPRFGRMDPLCRLALAAIESMGVDFAAMPPERRERIGLCVATTTGCVEVDAEYWKGAQAGEASPGLFIYTLPSTPIGEIAIRHKLAGPNLCLPCAPGAASDALREAASWIAAGEADAAIAIYVNSLGPASRPLAARIPELAAAPEGAWAFFVEAGATGATIPVADFKFATECERLCRAPAL